MNLADEGDTEAIGFAGALGVLKRGIKISPELKRGLAFSGLLAVFSAVGKLSLPILIQQVVSRGILDGYRAGFVNMACAVALVIAVAVYFGSRLTYLRLMEAAELTLYGLRVKTFEHIHRLSVAEHNESKRGVLVSRVTSDIDTIARFAQWGAISWVVNSVLVILALVVLAVVSWPMALVTLGIYSLMIPILRFFQRRQLRAYDNVRSAVGNTLGEMSETVMGGEVIRAYSIKQEARTRLRAVIDRQYRANMEASKYFSFVFTVGDLFGAVALATTIGLGVWFGPAWGLDAGSLLAVVFIVSLLQSPIGEIGEVLDQTQIAIAGWRKILEVLEMPIDIIEAEAGETLPDGPLDVVARSVCFSYRDGGQVLYDVDLTIPAGATVAIVGETGSGKTTFAKLLARLADVTSGQLLIGGHELSAVSAQSRRSGIRMVPQDGFLFDTTIRENVRFGQPMTTDAEIQASFERLGLQWWVERLPAGLDTEVGERGENLSVGERQLVALARAQLADPGVLILDEATSAVDPETERALSLALQRLAAGRTLVSVAHRLSTAESADLVAVFDQGRIVEFGPHDQLAAAGNLYARMFASWQGNTASKPVRY